MKPTSENISDWFYEYMNEQYPEWKEKTSDY